MGAPPETQGLAGGSYVYDLSSATPSVPVATLNNPSHALDDNFGYSVAISGTQIVVGALYDDTGATNTGIAYRYDISSPTPTAPTTNLYSFDLREIGAFGTTAVISGTRVVVGTYGDSGDSVGKVYAYDQSSATPLVPVELNGYFWGENFGRSLAISGSRLVVGATAGFGGPGHAYVYDLNSATPSVPVITLTSNNPDFGYSVAISGTRVVIGNYGSVSNGGGNAFVYDLVSATPTVPVSTLNNPTGQ